ncbi:MAG TPA: class I SAM-dependent methyltransferase [Thermoanaerobaculia bacterium]|nr:class I SAM-dependent methyltransferase [Thermoanaerobaculia bacterium]
MSLSPAASFDLQATEFDRRAGLGEQIARAVAAAVVAMTGVGPGERLLEIGAGTGLVGRWLLEQPVRYLGLDVSRPMLEVFRRRAAGAPLVQADAALPWPLPDGAARAVFGSRALHLLPEEHVVEEVFRVAASGAACVIGRVERPPESVKALLAREMRRRLRARGFVPRSAGGGRLLKALLGRGARELPRTVVASWPTGHSPRRALADWRRKEGLGGIVLPPGVQEKVLRELEEWAAAELGGLDAEREAEESYLLEAVGLP